MPATRTVRRLRVRAPDDATARHGGVLLEDALRTASLPGAGAELVLVRRLRLPPFRSGTSAQSVALRLEARCRALPALVLSDGELPDDAHLAAAPTVRFRDALAALTTLARLLAAGARPRAWCWGVVVPGYSPGLDLPEALARVAASVAALEGAPAALPVWLDVVVGSGAGDALARGLRRGGVPAVVGTEPPRERPPRHAAVAPWRALLRRQAEVSGEDGVTRWLASHAPREALVTTAPPSAPDTVSGTAAAPAAPRPRPPPGERQPPPDAARGSVSSRPPALRRRRLAPASAHRDTAPQPSTGERAARAADAYPLAETPAKPARAASASASTPPAAVAAPATVAEEVAPPTAVGGLLFLVHVLERCGFADWLEANPAWMTADLPGRIFRRLMERLRVPADDALQLLVSDLPDAAPEADAVRLPEAWRARLARGRPRLFGDGQRRALFDGDGRLPLALWRGRAPAGWRLPRARLERRPLPAMELLLCEAWLRACRRLLRRRLGIGPASLVRRPARAQVTSVAVDLWLPPNGVSLAVRRHGLDLDPGWVPWLSRVVRFHYGEAPR